MKYRVIPSLIPMHHSRETTRWFREVYKPLLVSLGFKTKVIGTLFDLAVIEAPRCTVYDPLQF